MAIRMMIEKTMSLHDYVYDKKIIRQKEGGSIGLDLTGVVVDIYMNHWDRKLKEILQNKNIDVKLYKRYKDDINLILRVLYRSRDAAIDRKERERSTLAEIMSLADSIHPSIKVTGDVPSNYEDNRLPSLDLKVWIGEVETDTYKVITSHYMKDVSTRAVINERSSHPVNMKKNVLVNEVMRILRNCNSFLKWEETADHISYFMKRLQFSGYDQEFRYEVVRKALKKQEEERTENQSGNNEAKRQKKKRWYEEANKVMFVQATKGGELKREIERCAKKNKVGLKVVEKVTHNIRKELQRSNPFKDDSCGKENCMVCRNSVGVDCRVRGCVYELVCEECQRKYRGQTGNSIGERTNEHFDDWKRGNDKSPLHRHSQLFHDGKRFPVSVKILRKCFGDPTGRKITEAVLIDELSSDETMNGKNEWTYVNLNKVSTSN